MNTRRIRSKKSASTPVVVAAARATAEAAAAEIPHHDKRRVANKFHVVCRRFDGRERVWSVYATEAEAKAVAARLVEIGCPARAAAADEVVSEGLTA